MLRMVAMPPGSPPARAKPLAEALVALNADKDYAADAMTTIQFVPHYGSAPISTRPCATV